MPPFFNIISLKKSISEILLICLKFEPAISEYIMLLFNAIIFLLCKEYVASPKLQENAKVLLFT